MMSVRRAAERGQTTTGWLNSRHSFSFGRYRNPDHTGFRALRVINEDRVLAGAGFGEHQHRDMEIISYVLEGALAHRDNLGNSSVIRPGEVQRVSAGTGIAHSEYNHSRDDPAHFLQIWIEPATKGIEPGYEQRQFAPDEARGKLRLVGSQDGADGAVVIHQDARMYLARLESEETVVHDLQPGRYAWVQVARGAASVDGEPLKAGDGAAVSEQTRVAISGSPAAEVLLFDLA